MFFENLIEIDIDFLFMPAGELSAALVQQGLVLGGLAAAERKLLSEWMNANTVDSFESLLIKSKSTAISTSTTNNNNNNNNASSNSAVSSHKDSFGPTSPTTKNNANSNASNNNNNNNNNNDSSNYNNNPNSMKNLKIHLLLLLPVVVRLAASSWASLKKTSNDILSHLDIAQFVQNYQSLAERLEIAESDNLRLKNEVV
jgi:hypothetical protein